MDVAERARTLAVLEFWHRIECFRPFDLEEVINDTDRQIRILPVEDLRAVEPEEIWRGRQQDDQRVRQFNLYLGIFDKSELITLCDASQESEDVRVENQERADLEGRSCFARLTFSPQGMLQLDSLSVSTVPWAIGVVRQDGWSELSHDRFESDVQRLHDRLRSWLNEPDEANQVSAEDSSERAFTGSMLLQLAELFYDWAHFQPKDQPLAVLDVKLESRDRAEANVRHADAKTKAAQDPAHPSKASAPKAVGAGSRSAVSPQSTNEVPPTTEPPSADEDEDNAGSQEVDILNSFYLRDLERVRKALWSEEEMPTIAAYLQGRLRSDRVDLYQIGPGAIQEALQPCHLNQGRWLDRPTNRMSLMQQFAINQSRRSLREKGVRTYAP